MKTIFTYLLCFSFLNVLSSQNFVTQGNEWKILERSFWFEETYCTYYRINGNILIENSKYSRVEYSHNNEDWYSSDFALRQDTFKCVYRKDFDNFSEEVKIYDFNLEVGDTIFLEECELNLIVLESDLITLVDGISRKQYFLRDINFGFVDYWIEGIGSLKSNSFFPSLASCLADASYNFGVYYLDNEILFVENDFECDEQLTGVNNKLLEQINVYPNPIEDHIMVEIDQIYNKTEIIIRNMEGTELLLIPKVPDNGVVWISELPSGIYVMEVRTDLGSIFNKIVKK